MHQTVPLCFVTKMAVSNTIIGSNLIEIQLTAHISEVKTERSLKSLHKLNTIELCLKPPIVRQSCLRDL